MSGKTVIILPDPKAFTPKDIAKYLLSEGVNGGLTTYVCENLTLNNEKNVDREGEKIVLTNLKDMLKHEVDMTTTIIIGNSKTKIVNGRMVTSRGYDLNNLL